MNRLPDWTLIPTATRRPCLLTSIHAHNPRMSTPIQLFPDSFVTCSVGLALSDSFCQAEKHIGLLTPGLRGKNPGTHCVSTPDREENPARQTS